MFRSPHVRGITALALGFALIAGLFVSQRGRGGRLHRGGNHIEAFGAVELPGNAAMRLPYCTAYLNGHGPYRLVVDSGAGDVLVISNQIADEIGLTAEMHDQPVYGLGGAAKLSYGTLDTLRIGEIVCRQVHTAFGPAEQVPLLRLIEGLVGLGVLAESRVTLDLPGKRLIVEKSSTTPAAGQRINVNVTPSAHVIADVNVADKPVAAMLDTGAQFSVISARWMKRRFPGKSVFTTKMPVFGFGDGQRTMSVVNVGAMVLAERRGDFAAVVSSDVEEGMAGAIDGRLEAIIGMDWFANARTITIDYPTGKAWIEWLDESISPP